MKKIEEARHHINKAIEALSEIKGHGVNADHFDACTDLRAIERTLKETQDTDDLEILRSMIQG